MLTIIEGYFPGIAYLRNPAAAQPSKTSAAL